MRHLIERIMHSRLALFSGGSVFCITVLSAVLIGNIYTDTQARSLIEAMAPSTRTLCFAIITASATIIPLMLTMLSFIHQIDREFDRGFYVEIKGVVFISSTSLILSVVLLLMLTMPLVEAENLRPWFTLAYYALVLFVATVSGLIVMVVVMLYQTVAQIIQIISPDEST